MTLQDFPLTIDFLNSYGEFIVEQMKSKLLQAGKDATGKLINSIRYQISFQGGFPVISFSMADYGIFVEEGRKAGGKQPPISAITPWLSIKGIPREAAFPIARKIAKEGIPPTPFFNSTFQQYKSQFTQGYEQALETDISIWAVSQINNRNLL